MKILITGASGLVGKALIQKIKESYTSYEISVVTRNIAKSNFPENISVYQWDPYSGHIDSDALKGIDSVIHLAGESVAESHWTKSKKKRILESRTVVTSFLKKEIEKLDKEVKFISASAIGIYGDQKEQVLTVDSPLSNSYLANVCKEWEKEIFKNSSNINSYAIRIGIVLSTKGGALRKMVPLFKNYLGAILGDGKQYMSWIHIDDLTKMILFINDNDLNKKVFNGVSGNASTNKVFSKALAKALNRKVFIKSPKALLKLVFGEMSEIMLASQNVSSQEIINCGFSFTHTNLDSALKDILKNEK